jgi:hypothetical protein
MPVCPKCNYEYVEGITICPDCGSALVPEEELMQTGLPEEEWVPVYTSFDEFEVDMIIGNLESAGITASKLSQKDHNFPAPGDLSVVKLMVNKTDVQSALEFIEDFKRENTEPGNDF